MHQIKCEPLHTAKFTYAVFIKFILHVILLLG